MGSDRAFRAAQLAWDNAEPPPDTRECDSCGHDRDLGREVMRGVRTEWWCEPCLADVHRCTGCGHPLEDRDGLGGACRYCSPYEEEEES